MDYLVPLLWDNVDLWQDTPTASITQTSQLLGFRSIISSSFLALVLVLQ